MARCGNGHDSATDDYCDICGIRIEGAGGGGPAAPVAGPAGNPGGAPAGGPPAGQCAHCGQPMLAGARFCELCGWDAEAATLGGGPPPAAPPAPPVPPPASPVAPPAPPVPPPAAPERPEHPEGTQSPAAPPGTWQLVAVADRAYFDTVQAMEGPDGAALSFPVYWPERRFPLAGERFLIGRASRSRGTTPEIDLGGQFTDPGISHLHAVLVTEPGGRWSVADLGSSNGTYLNDSAEPLEPHLPVPVTEGDRVHIGAWTTLILAPPVPGPARPAPPPDPPR